MNALPFKRNGVICLPILRTWGFKMEEGDDIEILLEKGRRKKVKFCSSSRRSKFKLRISSPPSPLPTQSHATRPRPTLPSVLPDKKKNCLSEKRSISTLKTFWKVAYGRSIPNQYEPVRDLPFPWKKLSLPIDSLPTEREMLSFIPSLRARNRDCLAVRNPWEGIGGTGGGGRTTESNP